MPDQHLTIRAIRLKFETIYGDDGNIRTPYMTRLTIGRLRYHMFHRGDADPDPHDHPWSFTTFPLTSYIEEVAHDDGRVELQIVRAFRFHYRPAEYRHRVIGPWSGRYEVNADGIPISAMPTPRRGRIHTIVWRGRANRTTWGFWCRTKTEPPSGSAWRKIPWQGYIFGDDRC